MIAKSKAFTAITLARTHLHNGSEMNSSAVACFYDACAQYAEGHDAAAHMWALKSLSYSIGIFHPEYAQVAGTTRDE